ncbi:AraC family transcriptional regulator [Streptomyces sp. NPDC050400]|uniref:AraC family transcriptional regulator n=1 Tax=Streptomyces sp. NPDC050400 TaxID=3365610 RepID=UPI0037947D99
METLDFDSSNLEVTEEFLSAAYTRMKLGSDAEGARTRVTRDMIGPIGFDYLDIACDLSHEADTIGHVLVCSVLSGSMERQYFPDGEKGSFGPGDLFLYTPHDRSYAGVIHRARYNLLALPPDALSRVAATAPGRTPQAVQLTGDRPLSSASARHLRQTMGHLREIVRGDPSLPGRELLASTAAQYVAATVLHTFPSTALTDPTIEDRHDAHPASLRRAVAFIDDHAHEDISVADIAAAVHVSIRTLQYVFRRYLDVSPTGYLRRVRLAHAHADLVATDPTSGVTVAEIATLWGFLQPARFAVAYRTAYGCPPLETLLHRGP